MKNVGNKYLEVDSVVARKGYGKHLYNFIAMYAHENNKLIISAMDGDTRTGALRNWERISKDNSFNHENLSDDFRELVLEETTKEDAPYLFIASNLKPCPIYTAAKLDNEDVSHFLKFRTIKEKYSEIFATAYHKDSTDWIDTDFPIDRSIIDKLFIQNKSSKKLKI